VGIKRIPVFGDRTVGPIKAAILLMLAASTCTLAYSKKRNYAVICTVKQVMLFHDAIDNPPPDDTPGAMAVLGTVHESELKTGLPTKPLGPNADLQDVANSSARNLHGAQFTVDLSLGNIAPIPFGPRRLLVPPKNLPESSDYATVFSQGTFWILIPTTRPAILIG
jgi:hypothetical protein